jgi:hypothetical protein
LPRNTFAAFGCLNGKTAPPKADPPMAFQHPSVSVALGYVGDIGEPGLPGIPFERVIHDDVPEAARPSPIILEHCHVKKQARF